MSFLSVILAAVANFAFGAIWYMSLAKPWMAASGVEVGEDGRPANNADPIPYITSFVAAVLVAGMMRHVFALSAIDSFSEGALAGFGIGLFLVTPWIATFMDLAENHETYFDRWRLCHDWVLRHGCRSNATLKTEGFR